MKKKFMISVLVVAILFSLAGCSSREGVKTSNIDNKLDNDKEVLTNYLKEKVNDSLECVSGTTSKIYNDDIYEFVDPDTGIHYWIYSHKAGYGGMGGMTPRLNPDGSVMCDK